MTDMDKIVQAITRVTYLLISVSLLGCVFFPDLRPIMAGFLIGAVIGLINVRYLAIRIHKVTESVVNQESRRFGLGFGIRFLIALLGVMAALRFEQISVEGTAAGLIIVPLLLIPVGIFLSMRS